MSLFAPWRLMRVFCRHPFRGDKHTAFSFICKLVEQFSPFGIGVA